MTIADYQAANQKLVEERAVLRAERDEARGERDTAKNALTEDRNDVLDLLGISPDSYQFTHGSRKPATKVQIARRAGELVATERFFFDLKKEFFTQDIIEGAPLPLPPFIPASEAKADIMRDFLADIKKESKRRARGAAIRVFIMIAVVITVGIIVGANFF